MKNANRKKPRIRMGRIVSYLLLATAAVSLGLVYTTSDESRSLGYGLNAAAYLLLGAFLLVRPAAPVLYIAVFVVGVLSALALAGDQKYGLLVGEIRLLELFVALLAVGLSEVLARRREVA